MWDSHKNKWGLSALQGGGVQVWSASLNQSPESIAEFNMTLSADERVRVTRFKFESDRLRFVAARGMLRRLLGILLETAPGDIRFRYGEYGKPSLADEFEDSRIQFNISCAGSKVLLAFAHDRELGIDIERIRPDIAVASIAERLFSLYELEKLRSLNNSLQTEAFFICWTRKEAFIKALGRGLSFPLDGFDVPIEPGQPAALVNAQSAVRLESKWSMRNLDVGEGYKAAIVGEGHGWNLSVRTME